MRHRRRRHQRNAATIRRWIAARVVPTPSDLARIPIANLPEYTKFYVRSAKAYWSLQKHSIPAKTSKLQTFDLPSKGPATGGFTKPFGVPR